MPARVRDFVSALQKKGFQQERQTTDKIYYFYYRGQKTEIFTQVSFGRGEELRATLLGKIKRQLQLDNPDQLMRFIGCPMTDADYIKHLQDKGIIPT